MRFTFANNLLFIKSVVLLVEIFTCEDDDVANYMIRYIIKVELKDIMMLYKISLLNLENYSTQSSKLKPLKDIYPNLSCIVILVVKGLANKSEA